MSKRRLFTTSFDSIFVDFQVDVGADVEGWMVASRVDWSCEVNAIIGMFAEFSIDFDWHVGRCR